ncbi:hypothetical protein EOE18_09115 [Novosphingobium umbonatum]|uniref:Flippase-like domain-containing protein n=1 Tax=Novosphingobium umbonatum TaxID=1908524 RepID=A0A437N697_9SPHN|nr:lysylphosphatidylglycerol synthase domain-containing protein [Novosphingobium umbonatum]RVU05448.1 hypothetical protein EOE18_09115 [Novosphingobium umbonatum]
MLAKNSPRPWAPIVAPALLLLVLIGAVAGNGGLRQMLVQAWGRMDPWAVAAVLPVQFLAILLCTAAQQTLKVGIPFRYSLVARMVRDAAHNLLIFPPGLGEVVGARMVVLLGGRGRAAIALRALDMSAEILAEIPYLLFAGWVLWTWWRGGGDMSAARQGLPQGSLAVAALLLLALGWAVWRWLRGSGFWARFWHGRQGRRLRAEWHLMRRELARQKTGMPLAIGLHFLAWGLSAVQMWVAGQVLGFHLSLFAALAVESAATSARVVLFFIPGGLVMQEAGAVVAGAAMGLAAPQALALSLVLRLRDVVFGLALLGWPVLEYRVRRRGI